MQKINTIVLSSAIIIMGIIVLVCCIFVLPGISEQTANMYPEVAHLQYPILLGIYASAIPFIYALTEIVIIIHVAFRESIFSSRIVEGLNHIKVCAYTIIVLYAGGMYVLDYSNAFPPLLALMGLVIVIVSIIVALGADFIKHLVKTNQMKGFNK